MIVDSSILIYDEDKKILFSKRSKNKHLFPSYWTMGAEGYTHKGEKSEDTAHRELREELGFDTDLTFLHKVKFYEQPYKHLTSCYIGKYQGEEIVKEPLEIADVRFLNEYEFNDLLETGKATEFAKQFARDFWSGKYDKYIV